MAHERWMKMVEKASFTDFDGIKAVLADDVVKLLTRQHRGIVRSMKKLDRYRQGVHIMLGDPDGEFVRRDDILAALKKQGGGGKKK